jgi:hypothetical protein
MRSMLDPGNPMFNIGEYLAIRGALDLGLFEPGSTSSWRYHPGRSATAKGGREIFPSSRPLFTG